MTRRHRMSPAAFDDPAGASAPPASNTLKRACEAIQKRERERYVAAPLACNQQASARNAPDWCELRPVATKLVNDFAPIVAPSKANRRPRRQESRSPQDTYELKSKGICDSELECDFHWRPNNTAAKYNFADGQTPLTRQPINQQTSDPAGRRAAPPADGLPFATQPESGHHRTKTRRDRQMGAAQADTMICSRHQCIHMRAGQRHNGWLSAATVRWQLIQIALIYTLLTSDSLKIAQATTGSTNYWPLVHQHRYQQLLFTGRMQQQPQEDELESRTQVHRRLLGPIRPQQSAAAASAASAAIAATASAAQARKSQSHNLLIGQNYSNFSSIIPYSLMQDVDYPAMPEDPLINEHDMPGESSNEHGLHADIDEVTASDSGPTNFGAELEAQHHLHLHQTTDTQAAIASSMAAKVLAQLTGSSANAPASDRAILDSNRLILPQMQQIKARFNQGCVGGTKCQFFAFCWMSGGSLGASCGLLMTCCVTPSRQEIQPGFFGPVVNDPYCGRSTSKINRIVGGTDASFGQFPWQAFVQVGGSRCGGALISSRHVVTAGHCVARSQHSPSSIKVTLGDYILNSDIESIPHEVYSVVEVLLHPNFRFTPQADRYDVAVLELDRAATYKDNIKPICLPQKDATFVGRVAYVAGWGALQAGSKLRPKVLQHVAVPVIENQVCESWHRRKGIDIRIYDEMMCAGYELGQRDACQGDSGGPLMLNQFGVWYLVGIVSAGYSCAKQYQPGIYHRVSSSSDWISSNVYQQGNSKVLILTSAQAPTLLSIMIE